MGFWSTFDWGSLTGGIIGALGAFLAAWLVYQRQDKQRALALELKTMHSLKRTVERGLLMLQATQNMPFEHMINTLDGSVIQPVEEFMPEAAESSENLYRILLATTMAVSRYLEQRVPENVWNDLEFCRSDSSVTLANDVREAARSRYLELIREVDKIKEHHPWHKRAFK